MAQGEIDTTEATCNRCGRPISEHEIDQMTMEPTKCPVSREVSTTPAQEHARSPRGDY